VVTRVDGKLRLLKLTWRDLDNGVHHQEVTQESCVSYARPQESWSLVLAPIKKLSGAIVDVRVPALPGKKDRTFLYLFDWAQADPLREGGPIYLRDPLVPGTTLRLTHLDGSVSRVTIRRPKSKPVTKKASTKTPSKYDHLFEYEDD
jgi:hypothetical protein